MHEDLVPATSKRFWFFCKYKLYIDLKPRQPNRK